MKTRSGAKTKLLYFFLGVGSGLLLAWVSDRVSAYRWAKYYEEDMARYDSLEFMEEEPQVDVEALLNLELVEARTGAKTTLGAAGDKVIFVNLWATWCSPCIQEMPSIARLGEARPDSTALFLLSSESFDKVQNFAQDHEPALPFYRYELEGSGLERIAGQAIPRTFIIHRGAVALDHAGAAPWDSEKVLTLVDRLAGTEGHPDKQ
jgi:thiol-disulfide isomerase/thioredoxin